MADIPQTDFDNQDAIDLWLPEAMDKRVIIVGSLSHYNERAEHSNHGQRKLDK